MARGKPQVEWTPRAVAKVREHGLSPEEVEAVIARPSVRTTSRSSNLPLVFGLAPSGRFIAVVYEMDRQRNAIYPVTAYPVEE